MYVFFFYFDMNDNLDRQYEQTNFVLPVSTAGRNVLESVQISVLIERMIKCIANARNYLYVLEVFVLKGHVYFSVFGSDPKVAYSTR